MPKASANNTYSILLKNLLGKINKLENPWNVFERRMPCNAELEIELDDRIFEAWIYEIQI